MSVLSSPKLRLLYLMKTLIEETDEQHVLTAQELINKLALHGIKAERKSIYTDIELLIQFGLDIEHSRRQSRGYFISSRDFELPEVKLLVDAVQSSRLITEKKSEQLIRKLSALTSIPQARQLKRQVYIAGRVKGVNEAVYYNVDAIHTAINDGYKIRFKYFDYNTRKERVYRKNGELYVQTPVALWWSEDNYYLIAYSAKYDGLTHYRVDRMSEVTVTEEPCDSFNQTRFRAADHAKRAFGMYSGETVTATLAFENNLVSVVLDHFGGDIRLIDTGERFTVKVEVSQSPVFFGWMLQFGKRAEVLEPESLRRAIRESISESGKLYD